jgi:hypothetical protein
MKDRRTVAATIGAVVLTLAAGGAAIAANLGILDSTNDGPVGQLSPVADVSTTSNAPTTTAKPTVQTIYVDQYVTDGAQRSGSPSAPAASGQQPSSADSVTSVPSAPAPVVGQSTPPVTAGAEEHSDDPEHAEDSETSEDSHPEDREEPKHLEGAEDDD